MNRKRLLSENQRISRENSARHGNPREDPSSQGNCIENTTHRENPSGSRPNPSGISPNNNNEDDLNFAISSQGDNSNNSDGLASDHHKTVVTIFDQNGERKMVKTTAKLLFVAAHPQGRVVVPGNVKGQPIGGRGKLLRRFLLEIPNRYVWMTFGKKWRNYKHDLKKLCFNRNDGENVTLKMRPSNVCPTQFVVLVSFWGRKKIGIDSRSKQKRGHAAGSKSFARLEDEMHEKGEDVGCVAMYEKTHTRKNGKPFNSETEAVVAQISEETIQGMDRQQVEERIMSDLLGRERNGWVRGDGMGKNPYRTQSGILSSAHQERRQEIARIEARHAAENAQFNSKLYRLMKFVELNLPGAALGADLGDQTPQSQVPKDGSDNADYGGDGGTHFVNTSISSAQSRCGK
ncbi:Transposase, Ptta/En/Spm, plant [Corchorus capsularis]|uniref:Transposase, Ptta/En/Spm, plant n=1 Tax=Corchorus capsularis TaxID=210143 RepID=A0A1R3FXI7_COCAP|nr:Transposase, Ptta/En/Spm, plant [Corchorus capsularis]